MSDAQATPFRIVPGRRALYTVIHAARYHQWLLAILALALGLRLAYGLTQDHRAVYAHAGGDSGWYLANGYALVSGHNRSELPVDLARLPTPPLYLLFIGAWQVALPPEAAVVAIRVSQALMGVATCYLAYRLGEAVAGDERAGLIAGGALALSPAFIVEAAQITTETLYIMLVAAGLWVYVRAPDTNHPLTWLGVSGLLLGLATLTRAVLLLFPLGLLVHAVLAWGWRAGLRRGGLLLLVYGLVVSSWTVYNLARWNRLVIGAEGLPAFVYIGATGWDAPDAVDSRLGEATFLDAASQTIAHDPAGYIGRRLSELGAAYLQPHGTNYFPGESLKALALDWLRADRTLSGLLGLTAGDAFWVKLSIYVLHYAGLLLGAVGMWLTRRQWRAALPLVGFVAYTTVVHLPLSAIPRYIFPAEVVWWVFAGVTLVHAWRLLARSATWQLKTKQEAGS